MTIMIRSRRKIININDNNNNNYYYYHYYYYNDNQENVYNNMTMEDVCAIIT